MRPTAQLQTDIDERLRAVVIKDVAAHTTAGEAFDVRHTLGVTPSFAIGLPFSDARTWAEEADRRVWNEKKVVLRCTVAAAPMSVLIVA